MSRNIHAPIEHHTDDLLGRSELAGRIYKRLSDVNCPQAVGIYGGWGTGKTSMLNLLQNINKQNIAETKQDDLHFIVIDAWKYESEGNLLIPVIVKIKKLLGSDELPDAWQTVARRVLAASALTVFDAFLKKFTTVDRKDIRDTFQEVKGQDTKKNYSSIMLEWESLSDDVEGMEDAFRKVIEEILKRNKFHRIIFCVDNLDRCSPDHAINLLESIRNFFSVSNCTWVLAVDSDVIASYVSKKYEDTYVDGYSYLDKVTPEQYHLSLSPTLDREGIADILNSAAGGGDAPHRIDESKIPQIPKILVPRRLLKAARKFYEYYQDPAEGVSPDMILGLTLLYHTWPDFYQRLSSASKAHIGGLFDHFFEADGYKQARRSIPLSGRFAKDEELIYFIRTAFGDYENFDKRETLLQEILLALRELKRLGLP